MIQATKKLLGLLLLLLLPIASAFAQPDLTVGKASGKAGDIVNTDVSFTNGAAGVTGTNFDITYNAALVTPGTVQNGAALAPRTVVAQIITPGTLRVLISPLIQPTQPPMQDGVLFTVPWTIAASAAEGKTPLTLANAKFTAATGTVPAGTLTPGEITITAAPVQVTVPNVVGGTEAAARTAITGAGLTVGTVTQQSSATVPAGSVISQDPDKDEKVDAGTPVDLVVSSGPPVAGAPIPTLSEWAVLLLSLLLGGVVWRTHTRRSSFHA